MGILNNLDKYVSILPKDVSQSDFTKFINSISDNDLLIITKILDELFEYKTSDLYIKLPVKPPVQLYLVNPCREFTDKKKIDKVPKGCTASFTEQCSTCEFYDKECKPSGYAHPFWFHIDSPYVSLVLNRYDEAVFINKDDCIAKCKEMWDPELVDISQNDFDTNCH